MVVPPAGRLVCSACRSRRLNSILASCAEEPAIAISHFVASARTAESNCSTRIDNSLCASLSVAFVLRDSLFCFSNVFMRLDTI